MTNDPQFHPLADMVPNMSDEEYSELLKDIRNNGLKERIVCTRGKSWTADTVLGL